MTQSLLSFIKVATRYESIRHKFVARRQLRKHRQWEQAGKPAPAPHFAKQMVLRQYAAEFGLKVLCETGTFRGDMIQAMRNDFDRIYSIELSQHYHQRAQRRFAGADHIQLMHGDSGIEIRKIVGELDEPALFWLDGHYSGGDTARGDLDTPILAELSHILSSSIDHVVVIDDARCFGAEAGYPDFDTLVDFVSQIRPDAKVFELEDTIRVIPKATEQQAIAA